MEEGKMAKIYQFEEHKREKQIKQPKYSETYDKELINNLMDTLILTYEQRISDLQAYKKEIAKKNGKQLKGPRELLKTVKMLKQMLESYGVSCNFFRFYTIKDLEVIYYNETSLVYVVKRNDHNQGMTYSVGEFIAQYEGFPFTLDLDSALFNIFDKQIERLQITIETLNNTEV